jgi:hypothetical protein
MMIEISRSGEARRQRDQESREQEFASSWQSIGQAIPAGPAVAKALAFSCPE